MTRSLRRCVPLTALAACGLAPAAHAAGAPPSVYGTAGGPKGYGLSVSGSAGNASVQLAKTRRGITQTHSIAKGGRSVAFSTSKTFSKGRLKTGLGGFGAIDLKFTPTGPLTKGPRLAKGCSGTRGVQRKGVLAGTLKYRLKGGGTLYRKARLSATMSKGFGIRRCTGGGGGPVHSTNLFLTFADNGINATISRFKGARVSQSVFLSGTVRGVFLSHSIFGARTGASYFSYANDLSSASAKGVGGPLTGSLRYTANGPASGTSSFGTTAGALKAAFDFIGTKTLRPRSASINKY